MPEEKLPAIIEAVRAAQLAYPRLAQELGVSKRTVQRWVNGQSSPAQEHWRRLATLVHPRDAELAARLAGIGATTIDALGLQKPAAASADPAAARITRAHADAIVCAAADEMDVRPRKVRRAVAAAFARAVDLGYPAEAVARALREDPEALAPDAD